MLLLPPLQSRETFAGSAHLVSIVRQFHAMECSFSFSSTGNPACANPTPHHDRHCLARSATSFCSPCPLSLAPRIRQPCLVIPTGASRLSSHRAGVERGAVEGSLFTPPSSAIAPFNSSSATNPLDSQGPRLYPTAIPKSCRNERHWTRHAKAVPPRIFPTRIAATPRNCSRVATRLPHSSMDIRRIAAKWVPIRRRISLAPRRQRRPRSHLG